MRLVLAAALAVPPAVLVLASGAPPGARISPGAAQGPAAESPSPVVDALEPADLVARIVREATARGRAHELLTGLCEAAPHRLSGSPGAAAAVEWGRQTLVDLGFENVRLEPVTVPRWIRGRTARFQVVSPPEAAGELATIALGGSVGTPPGGLVGPVRAVRTFAELDALGERARDAIVFFCRPMERTSVDAFAAYGAAVPQRTQGAVRAARAGGVAALVRSITQRLDDVPHTGALRYEPDVPRVPGAAVSTLAAERLEALLERHGEVVGRLELDCRDAGEVPSWNVVGELVGRELPDEVLVVGGHLDAWDVGQGAHDDGAGCCQSIEAVRLLADLGLRPRRTIRVVLFMNEENGLRGGSEYYRTHFEEMDRHVLALESDRGGFAPRAFVTDAGPRGREVLEEVVALFEPYDAGRLLAGPGGADVSPMRGAGVVTVGLVPDSHRYFDVHHSASDTLDTVHPAELELGAALMAAFLYQVAERAERLPPNPRIGR